MKNTGRFTDFNFILTKENSSLESIIYGEEIPEIASDEEGLAGTYDRTLLNQSSPESYTEENKESSQQISKVLDEFGNNSLEGLSFERPDEKIQSENFTKLQEVKETLEVESKSLQLNSNKIDDFFFLFPKDSLLVAKALKMIKHRNHVIAHLKKHVEKQDRKLDDCLNQLERLKAQVRTKDLIIDKIFNDLKISEVYLGQIKLFKLSGIEKNFLNEEIKGCSFGRD
ncbi:uncharacterized protein LOC135146620 isoform X2 [Zophobas morio]|uniref:uncharacterized protein LOC135146620 isoform X2 n=1 Tax=Zophobas morio TaxID=2755281 RepID=UPI0030835D43